MRGLAAATRSISSRCAAGRSMPSRSAPSVSCALPTKTSATSLACGERHRLGEQVLVLGLVALLAAPPGGGAPVR